MKTYNPDSTIILGDFNMSATPYAPDKIQADSNKLTKFEPVGPASVFDSFYRNDYVAAVRNRFVNTAENKQFDNIWLPKELYQKAKIETKPADVPDNKFRFDKTENVLRLQDIFVGGSGNKELIMDITDHHLVFVDLEIDLSKDNTT